MPQESTCHYRLKRGVVRRGLEFLLSSVQQLLDRLRYGGKPHGTAYANTLKHNLAVLRNWMLDAISPISKVTLLAVHASVREVVIALMENRVELAQLEPEVCTFEDLLRWERTTIMEAQQKGILSWRELGVRNEIEFGVWMLEVGTYYNLLRLDSRQALVFGDEIMRRMRRERI